MAIKGSGSPMEAVDEYFDMLIKSRFIEMFGDIKTNSKGWKCHKLGELGSFKTGGTPSSKHEEYYQGTIPFISTPALGPNYIDDSAAKYHISKEAIENCATTLIPAGSLIIGTRINVGQSSINKIPMCTNQDIISMMDIDKKYDLLFLKHCLNQYIPYLDSQKKGATIKGITVELLKSVMIPEPPIDEQKQYVDFVEQVDKSKAVCKQIFQSLDNLVKSRFIEMFGAVDNPKVPFEQLGNIATYVNGYAFKPSDWGTKGLPIIRIQNLSGSGDSFNYYSGTYPPAIEINKGDIMISWSATLGVFVWDGPKALLNQHIFKVYFDKLEVNPTYFRVAVGPALERSASKVHGSTMTHLTKKTFDSIMVPLPSINQQNEFASFVHQVDKSKAIVQKCIDKYDLLVKSRFIEMFGDPYLSPKYQKMPFMHCLDFNPGKSEVKNVPDDLMVSFVPMDSVGTDGSIDVSKEKTLGEVRKGYTYFRDNDVVFAKITPCFENGKVSIAKKCRNGIGFGTTEFHVARPKEGISNSTWLFYLLRSDSLRMLASGNMSGTAGQKRVQQPFFEKISIGLPPINEQESFASFVKQVDKSKFEVVQSLLRLKSKYIRTETPSKRTDCDL